MSSSAVYFQVYTSAFKGKVCWISGASSGIGRATALLLASQGAHVYLSARRQELLEQTVQQNSHLSLHSLALNVLDYDALEAARDEIIKHHGQLDLLIANAGVYEPTDLAHLSARSAREVLETNLIGASNMILSCVPTFIRQGFGQIAGVASVVGYRALPKAIAYGASKSGLIYFLESLRFELEPKGVSVSVINPGFVKTRLTDKNSFAMPFLLNEEQAASKIIAGLAKRKDEIAFPWQMIGIAKFTRLLPNCVYKTLARICFKS